MSKLWTILSALLISLLSTGLAHAQNVAQCPPISPTISSAVAPVLSGVGPASCDFGFTVSTTMVILQGPVDRHFFKIQNTSAASSGANLGICFARLESGQTCTMANAGTVLQPGQAFYQPLAMYGGLTIFNSMFFKSSIELISSSTATVSATIE